jgi:hypothetical protein
LKEILLSGGVRSAPIGIPTSGVLADDFSDLLLFWPGSRFGADLHPEALRLLEEAIARNPGYGPALAWAAICCVALDTILGWQAQNAAFRPKMCEGGLLEGPRMVVAASAITAAFLIPTRTVASCTPGAVLTKSAEGRYLPRDNAGEVRPEAGAAGAASIPAGCGAAGEPSAGGRDAGFISAAGEDAAES